MTRTTKTVSWRDFRDAVRGVHHDYTEGSLGRAIFLLAIPIKGNLFEPGSIKQSVFDCEDDIRELMREITISHRVIDYLHGEFMSGYCSICNACKPTYFW